jgi:BirA family biotin operon repressor/biotin-[acetyl-CoA-carboxylase] ligase
MIGDRKVGGILTHQIGSNKSKAIVAGLGLNVSLRTDELPTPTATSLQLEGATEPDRGTYLIAYLRELENLLLNAETEALIDEYSLLSSTIGREVSIELPGAKKHTGMASRIDLSGALVLEDGMVVSAGDVVHLR